VTGVFSHGKKAPARLLARNAAEHAKEEARHRLRPPGTSDPYRPLKVEQEWMWLGLNDEISAVPVVLEAEALAFEFQKPSHRISFDV
jgi:hypothetical protein